MRRLRRAALCRAHRRVSTRIRSTKQLIFQPKTRNFGRGLGEETAKARRTGRESVHDFLRVFLRALGAVAVALVPIHSHDISDNRPSGESRYCAPNGNGE